MSFPQSTTAVVSTISCVCVCVSYPHTTEAVVSAISLLVCPILKPQQPPFQRCRPVSVLSPNDNSHSLSDVVCACPILKPQQPPSLGYGLCVENGTKTHLSSIACMCCMRIKPTTSTTVQATGSRLPNYGRDPRKLRARPLQTTGATLSNYGRRLAPGAAMHHFRNFLHA